jgi:hypothetical protein
MAFFLAPGCSSGFSGVFGVEVDDNRDGSSRCCFMAWLFLGAKPSHMGVNVDGLAYPLHRPMTSSCQMRGQGLLPGIVLSHHYSGQWSLSGDVKPPRLHGVYCFYQDLFTLCQNHYGVYACTPSRDTIPDSDRMDPSTQVSAVRCAWAPATASYLTRQ